MAMCSMIHMIIMYRIFMACLWLIKCCCDYTDVVIHASIIHVPVVCPQNDSVWSSQQKSLCCHLLYLRNADLGLTIVET